MRFWQRARKVPLVLFLKEKAELNVFNSMRKTDDGIKYI